VVAHSAQVNPPVLTKKGIMITKEEVLHIAKLANISLSEDDIPKFHQWLSEALDYVRILDEIDTEGVEPTYQVTDLEGVYRPDKEQVEQHLSQEEALSNVPLKSERGYFKIGRLRWG